MYELPDVGDVRHEVSDRLGVGNPLLLLILQHQTGTDSLTYVVEPLELVTGNELPFQLFADW